MKIALSTDWHVGISERFPNHREDTLKAIQYCIDFAIQNKADHFINMGDTFHTSSGIKNPDLLYVKECIDQLVDNNIQVHFLVGNHDYHPKSDLLSIYKNIGYGDRYNVVNVDNYPYFIDDVAVLIPYLLRRNLISKFKTKYAFMHQEVTGALDREVNDGPHDRIFNKDEIEYMEIESIYSGHMHVSSTVSVGDVPIHYIGSTAITSFPEGDVPHYVCLLNTETGEIKKDIIPQRKWLTVYSIPDEVEVGVVYKLRLSNDHLGNVGEIREKIESAGGIPVDIHIDFKDKVHQARLKLKPNSHPKDLLASWLKYNNIATDPSLMDKHDYIDILVS